MDTGIALWPHGDRAESTCFGVFLGGKKRTMTVGSCNDRTVPARLSHGCRTIPVQCPLNGTNIKQSSPVPQSHGDCTMIVRSPYDVSLFESAGVSALCCILFYTFEIPSQLK